VPAVRAFAKINLLPENKAKFALYFKEVVSEEELGRRKRMGTKNNRPARKIFPVP
jgi:hypothetical protein